MYGFFSQKYVDAGLPTSIYRRPDGQEFECCFVAADPAYTNNWSDFTALGEVGQWVRAGRKADAAKQWLWSSGQMQMQTQTPTPTEEYEVQPDLIVEMQRCP